MATTQREFSFTLHLAVPELTDELADALYEAGCDDALVGMSAGTVFLDFTRAADSYEAAVRSALADVRSAGIAATVAPAGI